MITGLCRRCHEETQQFETQRTTHAAVGVEQRLDFVGVNGCDLGCHWLTAFARTREQQFRETWAFSRPCLSMNATFYKMADCHSSNGTLASRWRAPNGMHP